MDILKIPDILIIPETDNQHLNEETKKNEIVLAFSDYYLLCTIVIASATGASCS